MYVYMGAYGDHKYTHIWLAINQSPILFVRSGRDCCINKDIFVDMILGVDSVNAKLVGVADAREHEHIVLVFMASLCVCVFASSCTWWILRYCWLAVRFILVNYDNMKTLAE